MAVTQKSVSSRAWIELGLLAALWGGSFLAMRLALDDIGPLTLVLHRTGWAALALWAVIVVMRVPVPRAPRAWGAFLVMGALNNAIPFALLAWGQLTLESGLTAIFNASTAVFGVLIAALVFADERLAWRKLIGVGLGVLGVAVAIGPGALSGLDLRSTAQGAVLLAAVSYACASVWGRAHLGSYPPVINAAGMLTCATLLILPPVLWVEGVPSLSLSTQTWGALAYVSIGASAMAYVLYYRVLAMAGSGNLMLVTLLLPPIAIVLGAVVLDERLTQGAFGGFTLLALGLLIVDGRILARRA